MRYLPFLIALVMLSCSQADNPLNSNSSGTLSLDINVVDTAGQNSQMEESIKSKLSVTIFDNLDKAVKSWTDLNQLPQKIPLASGTYYVIVESNEAVASEGNVFSHYAKTDLIQINGNRNQNIALTFNEILSPPDFSDFSFD